VSNHAGFVAVAVADNLKRTAVEQVAKAAEVGADISTKIQAFVNDGSKNWPTALATALCTSPELAEGTRDDMALLITKELNLKTQFVANRLSRDLSATARKLVTVILSGNGYCTDSLKSGLDIRNIVKAGKGEGDTGSHTINTRFEVDGVWLGRSWYPYEYFVTYETDRPWYFIGIRFAGDLIQLKTVLAMRDIGINQFINADEVAHKKATPDQLNRRQAINH
jgi:hypothetical protein